MKKFWFLLIVSFLIISGLFATTRSVVFQEHLEQEDFEQAESELNEWEKEDSKSGDLFLCRFLFFRKKSVRQIVKTTENPSEDVLYIPVKGLEGDSLYYYVETVFDEENVTNALAAIDTGIAANPRRLDLYFARAEYLQAMDRYKDCSEEVKRIIRLNRKYSKKWLVLGNAAASENEVEDGIHSVISALLSKVDDGALATAKELSQLALRSFSKYASFYNDCGLVAVYENDYNQAKKHFTNGHNLDPSDSEILVNLAVCCEETGALAEAKKWYTELLSSNDDDSRYMASRKLEILENQ